jgi:hypothetical protein
MPPGSFQPRGLVVGATKIDTSPASAPPAGRVPRARRVGCRSRRSQRCRCSGGRWGPEDRAQVVAGVGDVGALAAVEPAAIDEQRLVEDARRRPHASGIVQAWASAPPCTPLDGAGRGICREGIARSPHAPLPRQSGRPDLNRGPHRPERCALPGCATPRGAEG